MKSKRKSKKSAKQVGTEYGKSTARATRSVVKGAHFTVKEGAQFTTAFVKSFKRELKKKK